MAGKSGTRIRWTKTSKEGIIKSVKIHTAQSGAKYEAFIDKNEGSYSIRNVNSRHYVANGESPSKNLHVLKKNVKLSLEKLGVEFENELARDNSSRIPGENCAYKKSSDETSS